MAYRSSGADNNGMVSNLKRFGVISSLTVEEGFRQVDRRFFVPKGHMRMAHTDQPIKEGNIHISAPHIYGAVVEALELPKDASLSFLNLGSGTGYLTCIAASILGPRSSHYCIEIHDDAIEHCKEAIASWKESCPAAQKIDHIDIIHGNALELDVDVGECALGFDRIYIGAAIEVYQLPMFKNLLKPGGILVGPVDGELMKVVRLQTPADALGMETRDFTEELLSPVRFAPLVSQPKIETVIPARIWTPSLHQYYPDSFRDSCKAVLLCSHANYTQPVKPEPKEKVNAACMLPRALWLEILSYTHRDWFEPPHSEIEFLRRRLKEEQENAERANRARLEADARCHLAEKERDIYKLLALRWKSRHSQRADDNGHMEDIEEAATEMLLGGRTSLSILGLGTIFRRFHNQGVAFESSDDDEDDGEDASFDEDHTDRMEEDEEMLEDEGNEVGDESSASMASAPSASMASSQERVALLAKAHATFETSEETIGRQVRTVSITGEDI